MAGGARRWVVSQVGAAYRGCWKLSAQEAKVRVATDKAAALLKCSGHDGVIVTPMERDSGRSVVWLPAPTSGTSDEFLPSPMCKLMKYRYNVVGVRGELCEGSRKRAGWDRLQAKARSSFVYTNASIRVLPLLGAARRAPAPRGGGGCGSGVGRSENACETSTEQASLRRLTSPLDVGQEYAEEGGEGGRVTLVSLSCAGVAYACLSDGATDILRERSANNSLSDIIFAEVCDLACLHGPSSEFSRT